MPEGRLIDPQWLVRARQNRRIFALRIALVFGVFSILAWWALPRLEAQHRSFTMLLRKGDAGRPPAVVEILAASAGVFKVFWGGIAIGCAAALLLGFTGRIDTLLPVLNIVLLLAGAAALALTFYVFYAPAWITLEALR